MNDNVHVICPHCGTEFEIADGNQKVTASRDIPDGVYTLIPKNDKKLSQLKDLGIDITKFFGMDNPEVTFSKNETPSDEIVEDIKKEGYVAGKSLWRRWVMAQMFRALSYDKGYDSYYKDHYYYQYSWDTVLNELKAQTKIKNPEELAERQQFFNKTVVAGMIEYYVRCIKHLIKMGKRKHCHGRPYVHIPYSGNYFIEDLEESITEAKDYIKRIKNALSVLELYCITRDFNAAKINLKKNTGKGDAWRNAFVGAGAYYTLDNLIKFHKCIIPGTSSMEESIRVLKEKTEEYKYDYYKLFMFMKQVIDDNHYVYGSDFS